jgi:hypothetical protein
MLVRGLLVVGVVLLVVGVKKPAGHVFRRGLAALEPPTDSPRTSELSGPASAAAFGKYPRS